MAENDWSILLVDDEPTLLQLVSARLKSQGYAVITALNGEIGYQILKQGRPHLVVCDVAMPVLDGPGLCRRMRSEGDRTPFLFLTAKGQANDIVELLSAGADDYVVKPFDAGELLARVRAILRRTYPNYTDPPKPAKA